MLHNNEIITLIDNTISRLYAQQKGDPVPDLPEYAHDTEMVFYKESNAPMVASSIRQLSIGHDHVIDEMESDQVMTNDIPDGEKYVCRMSDLIAMCVNELNHEGSDEDKAEFLLLYCGILATNVAAHTPDFNTGDYHVLANYFYNQFIPFQGATGIPPRDYTCQINMPDTFYTLLRCLGGENCFSTYDLYIGVNTDGAFLTEDNLVSVLNSQISMDDALIQCDIVPLYKGEYASMIEEDNKNCLTLSHIISLAHAQETTDCFWNTLTDILFEIITSHHDNFLDEWTGKPVEKETITVYVQQCREAKRQG